MEAHKIPEGALEDIGKLDEDQLYSRLVNSIEFDLDMYFDALLKRSGPDYYRGFFGRTLMEVAIDNGKEWAALALIKAGATVSGDTLCGAIDAQMEQTVAALLDIPGIRIPSDSRSGKRHVPGAMSRAERSGNETIINLVRYEIDRRWQVYYAENEKWYKQKVTSLSDGIFARAAKKFCGWRERRNSEISQEYLAEMRELEAKGANKLRKAVPAIS